MNSPAPITYVPRSPKYAPLHFLAEENGTVAAAFQSDPPGKYAFTALYVGLSSVKTCTSASSGAVMSSSV